MSNVFEADFPITIVGAGGAGMIAALRAAQLGRQVLLLEKDVRKSCNSALSGGMIQAAGTRYQLALGVGDSPEQMLRDIMTKNGGKADEAVVRAICERSKDVVHFLADYVGLELALDTDVAYFGHSAYRLHKTPTESGAEIVAALRTACRGEPRITFVDRANVRRIEFEADRVVGIQLHAEGEVEIVHSSHILLGTDGFGANYRAIQTHCPDVRDALYIGSENNTGEGIDWGAALGAALDHMEAYQGHCHVNPGFGTRLGGAMFSLGAIMVNLHGRRFAREDQGYSEFARLVLAQPERLAIEIFDQRVFDTAHNAESFRDALRVGAIKGANSVADLAMLFGLPGDVLAAEIDEYNAAVRSGKDPLGRETFGDEIRIPIYGSKVTGALVHTQGGLRIDPSCHVLRPDGSVIEGLYAAGGTAAGMSGDGPEGYLSGNGLIHAFSTGFIAAETMARLSGSGIS